jgi:hypothetical protein
MFNQKSIKNQISDSNKSFWFRAAISFIHENVIYGGHFPREIFRRVFRWSMPPVFRRDCGGLIKADATIRADSDNNLIFSLPV